MCIRQIGLFALLAMSLAAVGCQHTATGGRSLASLQDADAARVCGGDGASGTIDDLSAAAAVTLGRDLPAIPAVKASDHQMVLSLGTATDHGPGEAGRAAAALAEVRQRLAGNAAVAGSFVLVDRTSDPARQAAAAGRESAGGSASGFDDPAQRQQSQTHSVVYNPDDIYILSTEFDRADDHAGANRTLTLTLRTVVMHGRSGSVVIDRTTKRVFRWNGDQGKFVPDA